MDDVPLQMFIDEYQYAIGLFSASFKMLASMTCAKLLPAGIREFFRRADDFFE